MRSLNRSEKLEEVNEDISINYIWSLQVSRRLFVSEQSNVSVNLWRCETCVCVCARARLFVLVFPFTPDAPVQSAQV